MRHTPCLIAALAATLLMATAAGTSADPSAPASAGDPHAGLACTRCHSGVMATAVAARAPADQDPRSRACRSCHKDVRARGATAVALGFHADPKADCAGCHTFHEPGRLKSAVGAVRMTVDARRAVPGHCAGCHTDGARLSTMTGAHRTAADLYHQGGAELAAQTPSQGCLNCHSASNASHWQSQTLEDRLVFSEHATHPLGMMVVPGSGQDERRIRDRIDPRLRLFDGRLECQTCHSLTSTAPHLLVAFATPGDMCLGCHQLRNARPDRGEALMATMMQP